jgi:hypothetical protein
MARKLLEVAAEVPGLGGSRAVAVEASRQRGSARPLYSNHAEYIDLLSSFLDTPTVISVPLIVVPRGDEDPSCRFRESRSDFSALRASL